MIRKKLSMYMVCITILIVVETGRSLFGVAYGVDTSRHNTQSFALVSKSSKDEIGIRSNKLLVSKSDSSIQDIMESQKKTLYEDKLEYEKRLQEEEEEKQRLAEEQRKEEEEARKKAEEEEQRRQAELEQEAKEQEQSVKASGQSNIEQNGSKMVINSYEDAKNVDIRSQSNWTYEDFDNLVDSKMKPLINIALRMEKEKGINAIYLMAVGANETGWGKKMSGDYNYYNWSRNGIKSLDFSSLQNFSDYSVKNYDIFLNPSNYADRLGYTPSRITPPVVNTLYALNINSDGSSSTNMEWTATVCKIMTELSNKRLGKGK